MGVPSGTAQMSPVNRKFCQVVQKRLIKACLCSEDNAISSSVKVQVLNIVDHLLQAGRNGKAAAIGHAAEEQTSK